MKLIHILSFLPFLILFFAKHVHSNLSIIRIYSVLDNLALDVRNKAVNGEDVTVWNNNTSDGLNQKWAVDLDLAFNKYASFKSLDSHDSLVLDEDKRSSTVNVWKDGDNLNRRWYFVKVSKYFQIVNYETKRCLTNNGRGVKAITTVCDVIGRNINQLWTIENFSTTPDTWLENWHEHRELLETVYSSPDVAIYYDRNVNKSIEWIPIFTEKVWRYVKEAYGNFGPTFRLYAIFHTDTYYGGHPGYFYRPRHYHRNAIDCGKHGGWEYEGGWNTDIIIHEISHIVEKTYNGYKGSPGQAIWGDSTFAEIFAWDIYLKTGKELKDVERMLGNKHPHPRNNSYWMRDWWVPMYDQYGGVKVFNGFFDLLAKHWPKDGLNLQGGMNYGEFFHFYSGAANTNLKSLATNAFGWTSEYEAQFKKAQSDYPNIRY